MKSLQDAFYNWLSIKVVSDARPDDKAAKETFELFDQILKDEHQVEEVLRVEDKEHLYYIQYKFKGEEKTMRFPKDIADFMLNAMESEPNKYPIYEQ